jgi:hypothetical protein
VTTPCPTCPTSAEEVGQQFRPGFIGLSDLSDLSDRKSQGRDENEVSLSALAARWRADLDHDAAEAEAMAEHYAAPAGAPLPQSDPLAAGLLEGFRRHRLMASQTNQKGDSRHG